MNIVTLRLGKILTVFFLGLLYFFSGPAFAGRNDYCLYLKASDQLIAKITHVAGYMDYVLAKSETDAQAINTLEDMLVSLDEMQTEYEREALLHRREDLTALHSLHILMIKKIIFFAQSRINLLYHISASPQAAMDEMIDSGTSQAILTEMMTRIEGEKELLKIIYPKGCGMHKYHRVFMVIFVTAVVVSLIFILGIQGFWDRV